VGSIEPRKNIATLIDAWSKSQIRDYELLLVGCKNRIFERVDLAKEIHGVRFLGRLPNEELTAFYTGAHACLSPTLYEGFGLPALEAMAVGTPVVASDRGGLPEALGGAGVILPLDDALWQAKIPAILNDSRQLDAMRNSGRVHAAASSWEHSAALLMAAFEEAAGFACEQ